MKTSQEQKSEVSTFKRTLLFTIATVGILLLLSAPSIFAQKESSNQAIPYTLADRDRLIQVESDIKSLRNEMQSLRNEMITKFESRQMQINDMKN